MMRSLFDKSRWAISLLAGIFVNVSAQSTCLPVDNTAKGIRAHLIMYSTAADDPYRAVRDSVKIPAFSTAQVPIQIVQVTTGRVCAKASRAFNQRAMLMNPGDNNPARKVYLFKVGTLWAVAGDYFGARADVNIYSSDFAAVYGSYIEPD